MKAIQLPIIVGWLLASGVVSTSDATAADLQYHRSARVVTRSAGCGRWHTCCPGRYSCASLYGGYGPYGGAAFWSQYTYGGWKYIR
jgi:hypothetical protein